LWPLSTGGYSPRKAGLPRFVCKLSLKVKQQQHSARLLKRKAQRARLIGAGARSIDMDCRVAWNHLPRVFSAVPLARRRAELSSWASLSCWAWLAGVIAVSCLSVGCNRSPYQPGPQAWGTTGQYPPTTAGYPVNGAPPASGPQSVFAQQQTAPQLVELQRRVQQLDDNNRQLTTQLAQSQQQVQAFRERGDLLAKQLQDATNQNKQLLAASQQYANQAAGMQASMSMRGGARLTANNSVANSASGLQIVGARVIPDGDLIRIRIPADQIFNPSTSQINPAAATVLDQVANALLRQFPRQRVGIEGHTDSSAPSGGGFVTPFQLAGAQAQAVMDQLVRRNGVPMQQLFVISHGPNHPLADNQSPAGRAENRRIELVVYPETF
jgi:flagellar motor protein MotB